MAKPTIAPPPPVPEAPVPSNPVAPDDYRLRRGCQDLYQRALIGPPFYLVAWLIIAATAGYFRRELLGSLVPVAVFIAFWLLRRRHRPPTADAGLDAYRRWQGRQWWLIHAGSVAWGVVPALTASLQGQPDSAVLVAAIATVAFTTAASQAFAMAPGPARISILLLILPGILACAVNPALHSVALTLFIYIFYLMANLRRLAAEYRSQAETEADLINKRAELAQLSLTDTLTGLPNRRDYERVWHQAWHHAARRQEPLSMLVLDLDHFKRINDRLGHLAGDACLRHFADLLREHFRRDSDFLARIGGEEFVVLLPGTVGADAMAKAEAFRAALAASPCPVGDERVAMTVSIGAGTVLHGGDADPAASFQRIDDACYAAKRAGRDRVVSA